MLRNEGVHYGAYISQISFLLFLKMDEEAASQLGEPSAADEDGAGSLGASRTCPYPTRFARRPRIKSGAGSAPQAGEEKDRH